MPVRQLLEALVKTFGFKFILSKRDYKEQGCWGFSGLQIRILVLEFVKPRFINR